MNIKRGEIYYIDYVPVIGQEQRSVISMALKGYKEDSDVSAD